MAMVRTRRKADGAVVVLLPGGGEAPLPPLVDRARVDRAQVDRAQVDWARVDATTEDEIARQEAEDDAQARQDAAAWAKRRRVCAARSICRAMR